MADAKVFEVSSKGEFPKSKSLVVEMHWAAWVLVGVVVLFLVVGVPSIVAGAERFQVLTSGGPQVSSQVNLERLRSKRRKQGFLNGRLDGPNVGGMSQELVDYYASAIAQPDDGSYGSDASQDSSTWSNTSWDNGPGQGGVVTLAAGSAAAAAQASAGGVTERMTSKIDEPKLARSLKGM